MPRVRLIADDELLPNRVIRWNGLVVFGFVQLRGAQNEFILSRIPVLPCRNCRGLSRSWPRNGR